MPKKIVLAAVTMLAALAITVQADVHLPNVFSEHMVLQRQSPIPVWGWADPGETVTVQLADSAQKEAVADAQGEWRVALDAGWWTLYRFRQRQYRCCIHERLYWRGLALLRTVEHAVAGLPFS